MYFTFKFSFKGSPHSKTRFLCVTALTVLEFVLASNSRDLPSTGIKGVHYRTHLKGS